jgi:hypothetical protein
MLQEKLRRKPDTLADQFFEAGGGFEDALEDNGDIGRYYFKKPAPVIPERQGDQR